MLSFISPIEFFNLNSSFRGHGFIIGLEGVWLEGNLQVTLVNYNLLVTWRVREDYGWS